MEDVTQGAAEEMEPSVTSTKRGSSWWRKPTVIGTVAGLVVGLAGGAGLGIGLSDPTKSEEYAALDGRLTAAVSDRDATEDELEKAQQAADDAREEASEQAAAMKQREDAVAAKEAAVGAREQAVAATEHRIASTTISEGTWTVGRDVEPGTYTTKAPVTTGRCYWKISTSGTNGSDIIENDIVSGGSPTVTISAGQDFETSRCGDWVKQG
jgi:hypothetical protein